MNAINLFSEKRLTTSLWLQFLDLSNIFELPKIQNIIAFGNLWGKLYTNVSLVDTKCRFNCSQSKLY